MALERCGEKKEEKWKQKKNWRKRPGGFARRRSRLVDVGLWRREEVDGGRRLGEEQLKELEDERRETRSEKSEIRVVSQVEVQERIEEVEPGEENKKSGQRVREVATIEEDELFGGSRGYPTTRRPVDFRRDLTKEKWR